MYDAAGSKPETVHRRASELLDNGKVAARLDELRAGANKYTEITLEEAVGMVEPLTQTGYIFISI